VGLHRRVAIGLLTRIGTRPSAIVGGFLLSSALISMWVSNTATALMMLPIATSVIHLLPKGPVDPAHRAFGTAVALAVAYGATTGGMATLMRHPAQRAAGRLRERRLRFHIGFGQWMLLGVPVMLVTLPAV